MIRSGGPDIMQEESEMRSSKAISLYRAQEFKAQYVALRSFDKNTCISIPYCHKAAGRKLRTCRTCCHAGGVTIRRKTDPRDKDMVRKFAASLRLWILDINGSKGGMMLPQ
jgi:hypothetical protein